MAPASLGEAFETFEQSAIRLEGLAAYSIPDEAAAFATWVNGSAPDLSFLQEWCRLVEGGVSAGKTHRRLRILDAPMTDYQQFEVTACYPLTSGAGEEIRIMTRDTNAVSLPDFWVFDDHYVFEMVYDASGSFIEASAVDADTASFLLESLKDLWTRSKPLSSL